MKRSFKNLIFSAFIFIMAMGILGGLGSGSKVYADGEVTAPEVPYINKITSEKNGIQFSWNEIDEADGYYIFKKNSEGKYEHLATVTGGDSTSYYDKTANKTGNYYVYTVTSYAKNGTKTVYTTKGVKAYGAYFVNDTSFTSVENTSKGVKLTWKSVSNATGYILYKYKSGKYVAYKTVMGTTYTDEAVKNGSKNKYKIRTFFTTKEGKSYGSAYSGVKTDYYVSALNIKSVANASTKSLTVKWNANSKATGYQIEYSRNSDFKSSKTVTVKSNSTVSKKISGLTKGKTYYVRIRSYKKVGDNTYYGAWSEASKVKVKK